MKVKKEIEEARLKIQDYQDKWNDFDMGFYSALCWVLGDRGPEAKKVEGAT